MSRAAVLKIVAAVILTAVAVSACGRNVGGTAQPAPASRTATTASTAAAPPQALTAILPDADQWLAILDQQPQLTGLTVQGTEALGRQDQIGDWSDPDCLGVVLPALESAFTAAPVTAVINGQPVFETYVAVIAYRDATAAGSLFGAMTDRWRQCADKTISDTSTAPAFTNVIADVHATPSVVSTTVTIPGSYPQVLQRALAQAGRCLIDVQLPVDLSRAGSGLPTPDDAATHLAAVMQDRAAAATC